MKVNITHKGFTPGTQEGIGESIKAWARQHLDPLLPLKGEPRLLVTVKRHTKGKSKYSVTLRVSLPRRHTLVAHGKNAELHAALSQAEARLLREVKKYKDRLHNQAEFRRKARRARLSALKALQESQPAEVIKQARSDIDSLLPRLESLVRMELAYLRDSGELPLDYPVVKDVVDEAVLLVMTDWQPDSSKNAVWRQLLRAVFKVLDREIESRRRFGEMISLESTPDKDAMDQAEDMVEEEIFEFYQPDESLKLEDVFEDHTAEQAESEIEAVERDYSMQISRGLPFVWRRVWMLTELEHLAASDIADILDVELSQVEQRLSQAREFIQDHLRQAGFQSPT